MTTEKRIAIKYTPIQNAAGVHGSQIGTLGTGTLVIVDMDRVHDGWAPIAGPEGLGPTWRFTGKEGWVELAHTISVTEKESQYLLTLSEDGSVVSCVRVS